MSIYGQERDRDRDRYRNDGDLDDPYGLRPQSRPRDNDGRYESRRDFEEGYDNQQKQPKRRVVVRSNTIRGDRAHAKGMVVARIIRGDIPVQNGVVHLIDKPLMIVANSLFEYIMVKIAKNVEISAKDL